MSPGSKALRRGSDEVMRAIADGIGKSIDVRRALVDLVDRRSRNSFTAGPAWAVVVSRLAGRS